jgi:hypothetical protein
MPVIDNTPLRKILELEQKKGYSNSTVFGGLDKFIRQWAEKTIETITDRSLLAKFQKLHLRTSKYASLTLKQRQEWVKNIIDLNMAKQRNPHLSEKLP